MLTHVATNEELWDEFVIANGGGFLQSWGWSRFMEAVGRTAYRFRIDTPSNESGAERHEDTQVQFLLVMHDLPLGQRYAYVPRGPVIKRGPGDATLGRFETFVGALRETLDRQGCLFARVEFPFLQAGDLIAPDEIGAFGFRFVKAVQPADTLIVDLDKSEADLLAAMHPKTRYNIRVAERHGVVIRDAQYDNAHLFNHDVELFWRLLAETSSRDQFHTHPFRYYQKMLDELSPRKKGGGLKIRLVFALHGGEAAAAAIVAEYGGTMTYLHGASAASKRSVMAPNLLHWSLIREAKSRGFDKYDFWGVAPTDDPDHPWAGITRFKTGFGGRHESYVGAWELPNSVFWYNLYRFAKRFKNV